MAENRRPHVPLEQRRRELARTAVKVMARDGAWALTTRAVAAEAGVPHGTVHYAFSSKDELLRAVLQLDLSHLADLAEAQRHRSIESAEDVREALAETFASYADSVIADPDTETAYFELSLMAARDPRLRAVSTQTLNEYRSVMARLLQDLAVRSELAWDADVGLLADQAVSVLFGAAVNWLEQREDARFRAVLADTAGLLARRLVSNAPPES